MEDKKSDEFKVILIGVIFDTKTRKILLGKRQKDPHIPKLTWCFPGGKLIPGEKMDTTFKRKIKEKTGYEIKNLGTIFSQKYPEKDNFVAIYFLAQVFKGEEKPGDDLVELKWVKPEQVENYFTTSFHTRLKEYIINLK